MEQVNEKNVIIESIVADRTNWDLFYQFEWALLLSDKPNLLGFMTSLLFFGQIGYVYYKTQKHLAQEMGFSEPTFIKNRKELEKMGLIEISDKDNRRTVNLKFLSRLKIFKLPSNPSEHSKYLANSRQLLINLIKNEPLKEGQPNLFNNVYINNTSKVINNSVNRVNSVKSKTYPKEDYDLVLGAFKKYKGVGLVGPEIAYHMRAIKMMFQAEHKPKEIIDFMKWLHDNERNEETAWVRNWTIWTVQKKIPEFLGGKLKVSNSIEEEFPAYGK